jgi:hypothetical protein
MSLRLGALCALAGCAGVCLSPEQDGPGLAGTMSYTTADGARSDATLEGASTHMVSRDAIAIHGGFVDAFGRRRSYELRAHELTPGTLELTGHGEVCMPRSTGGAEVCSELAGTIDVRRLAADCYHHESGVGACIEDLDFTLSATSDWQGTRFELAAEELTTGTWGEVPCDD